MQAASGVRLRWKMLEKLALCHVIVFTPCTAENIISVVQFYSKWVGLS